MENNRLAPWTDERVAMLNHHQNTGLFHPYTCSSPGEIPECERTNKTGEGKLIATKEGWICPCGKYKQNWAH